MDDVRIYSAALTAIEVASVYGNGLGDFGYAGPIITGLPGLRVHQVVTPLILKPTARLPMLLVLPLPISKLREVLFPTSLRFRVVNTPLR